MHPYGTDSNERLYFLAAIIPLSIWAASGARWLLGWFNWGWPDEAQFLFDPTSAVTFYALFYAVFNKWLWRWSLLHRIGLVTVPDVNGEWSGEVSSSFQQFQEQIPFQAQVSQTWSRMIIRFRTSYSDSHSETASFMINAGTGPTLSYTYLNRPKLSVDPALMMHQGTCVLVLSKHATTSRLEGEYYSSRGRSNIGQVWMERSVQQPIAYRAVGNASSGRS